MMLSHEVFPVPKPVHPTRWSSDNRRSIRFAMAEILPNLPVSLSVPPRLFENWVAEADRREGRRRDKGWPVDAGLAAN
jgi:hypothetical protein